jgi:hypothetical protein
VYIIFSLQLRFNLRFVCIAGYCHDFEGDWPLSSLQQKRLDINRNKLSKLLKVDDHFFCELHQAGCLTEWHKDDIQRIEDPAEKLCEFINIMRRRSIAHLKMFCDKVADPELKQLITRDCGTCEVLIVFVEVNRKKAKEINPSSLKLNLKIMAISGVSLPLY